MAEAEPRKITRRSYWALVGLVQIGRDYQARVDAAVDSAGEITGEDRADLGLTADTIYDRRGSSDPKRDVDALLKSLEIEVVDAV